MANEYICNFCPLGSATFANLAMLQEHIKLVHIPQRRSEFKVSPAKVKEIEEAKQPKDEASSVTVPVPVQTSSLVNDLPKRKPIILRYEFTGECSTCGVPVETHEIRVRAGLYMIAWCSSCRKQLRDIRVIPIEEMEKELTENESQEIAIEEDRSFLDKLKKRGGKISEVIHKNKKE